MSPASDPRYFGKSPFSHLKNASEVAAKIMRGETVEEEKPEQTLDPIGKRRLGGGLTQGQGVGHTSDTCVK